MHAHNQHFQRDFKTLTIVLKIVKSLQIFQFDLRFPCALCNPFSIVAENCGFSVKLQAQRPLYSVGPCKAYNSHIQRVSRLYDLKLTTDNDILETITSRPTADSHKRSRVYLRIRGFRRVVYLRELFIRGRVLLKG